MRKLALIAAAATALPAFGAFAETHRVDIIAGVFFPPIVLASSGDSIRFVNEESSTYNATALDDSWTTGDIAPGSSVTVQFASGMDKCFEATNDPSRKGGVGNPSTGEPPSCYTVLD